MGTAASLNNSAVNCEQNEKLQRNASCKTNAVQLRRELKEKDDLLQRKESQLHHRQRLIEEKDAELSKLRKEIHELKCVVQQTAQSAKPGMLSTIHERWVVREAKASGEPKASKKEKRMAVSGESSSTAQEETKKELGRHLKDFRYGPTSVWCWSICVYSRINYVNSLFV